MEIDVDAATLELITNYNYKVALVSTGPQLNVFPAYEAGSTYLTDTNTANHQYVGGSVVCDVSCYYVPADPPSPYGIAQDLNNLTITNLQNYFLFEGKSAGTGQLRVEIRNPVGMAVSNDTAKIEIKDIKSMYQRVVATIDTSIPNNTIGSWTLVPGFVPSPDETAHYIVHVHGWNNSVWQKTCYAETMFKRLYWQGYNGRFVAFQWPTYTTSWLLPPSAGHYNKSEYQAFKSGEVLADYLDQIYQFSPGIAVHLCAHSQGNIVVGEALTLAAPGRATHYVLTEAAVPAHCYDVDPTGVLDFGEFTQKELEDPTPDTYRGSFTSIETVLGKKAVNFYNPLDPAFTVWFRLNQLNFKPDRPTYYYDMGRAYYSPSMPDREVTDPFELMSHVARPRSHAIAVTPGMVGVVEEGLNLHNNETLNFGSQIIDHSGQCNYDFIRTIPFYHELMRQFELGPRL